MIGREEIVAVKLRRREWALVVDALSVFQDLPVSLEDHLGIMAEQVKEAHELQEQIEEQVYGSEEKAPGVEARRDVREVRED